MIVLKRPFASFIKWSRQKQPWLPPSKVFRSPVHILLILDEREFTDASDIV